MSGLLLLLSLVLGNTLSAQQATAEFPIPDAIRPAINFWIKVYTETDTQSGFLHDSRNLDIIYTRLKRDRTLIEATRKDIVADLKILASGKRSGLSDSQQQLLDLWGKSTSDERFELASNNVRWQLGQSDRYQAGLKRSGAYRQHIQSVVQGKNMPVELAALPHVESSFHPGAYSSAAASGMWQFVRETARRFMQVDLVVDERLDPYTATNAAMELLKYNYDALGSWPLALTAYNHGTNGMARAVRDSGTRDIGRIITDYKGPRFGFASRNFYPQFLAALEVERKADQYFGPLQLDPAPTFAYTEMQAFVAAQTVAEALGISLDTLRQNNPALLPAVWSGNKFIPKGFMLKMDTTMVSGDLQGAVSSIAAGNIYNAQIPDVSYVVGRGDSLSAIADRFKTSVAELVAINQLPNRHRIRIGQKLVLPQKNGVVPTLVVNSTEQLAIPDSGKYQVRRGDTVSVIAERFSLSPATLLALNNIDSRGIIYPGQELLLKAAPVSIDADTSTTIQAQLVASLDAAQAQLEEDAALEADSPTESEVELSVATLEASQADAPAVVDSIALQKAETADLEEELAADPANFEVAADHSIEILANETLGHYADWLGVKSWDLRNLNGMSYSAPVRVGERLTLNFDKVNQEQFLLRRKQFHSDLQAQYFAAWRIRDTEQYSIQRRDVLIRLAQQRSIPMWLFRQYNPEVDASLLQIGQIVIFPVVEEIPN